MNHERIETINTIYSFHREYNILYDPILGRTPNDLSVTNLNVNNSLTLQCQRLECILANLTPLFTFDSFQTTLNMTGYLLHSKVPFVHILVFFFWYFT